MSRAGTEAAPVKSSPLGPLSFRPELPLHGTRLLLSKGPLLWACQRHVTRAQRDELILQHSKAKGYSAQDSQSKTDNVTRHHKMVAQ